jgi:hypothetical protein
MAGQQRYALRIDSSHHGLLRELSATTFAPNGLAHDGVEKRNLKADVEIALAPAMPGDARPTSFRSTTAYSAQGPSAEPISRSL